MICWICKLINSFALSVNINTSFSGEYNTKKRGSEKLSEEKKKEIEEMVGVLKDLNMEELLVVKGVGIGLRAAQELKTEQPQSVKN